MMEALSLWWLIRRIWAGMSVDPVMGWGSTQKLLPISILHVSITIFSKKKKTSLLSLLSACTFTLDKFWAHFKMSQKMSDSAKFMRFCYLSFDFLKTVELKSLEIQGNHQKQVMFKTIYMYFKTQSMGLILESLGIYFESHLQMTSAVCGL